LGDLVIGFLVVGFASLLACIFGAVLVRRTEGLLRTLLLATIVALVLAFAIKVQGHLVLAQWLPFSNVIVVGNLTVVGTACLAGILLGWKSLPVWRRLLFAGGIGVVGMVALLHQMPRDPPAPGDEWIDEVCMQSNKASCSACAAATLLVHHGIPADEAEMMDLCLTGATGTPSLGLYRGLKLKTAGTPYEVEAFQTDIESLLDSEELPAILLVMLQLGADVDPRYENEWGWTPGLGHAVVCYGRAGSDRVMIGDPSVGREKWTIKDLQVLWHGEGLRLRGR
jgi:hypothetical protein